MPIIINGAMLDYLRKEDWMPKYVNKQKIQQAEAEIRINGDMVTDTSIAERLQLRECSRVESRDSRRQVLSSSVVVGDSEISF